LSRKRNRHRRRRVLFQRGGANQDEIMCCFSRPVQSVKATQIYARSAGAERQFVVYSMTLKAKEPLAMVLPLPVQAGRGEKAVEFIDLSGYAGFFDDLKKGFPESLTLANSRSPARGEAPPASKLAVVNVGNFEASFVPQVADFSRLDERFRLPPGVWENLPEYQLHGFAVFKLKAGEAKIHPMAFSFPRAKPAEVFFPTVHIHDGKVHERAKFDHVLYVQRGEGDLFSLLDWEESFRPAVAFVNVKDTKGIVDPDGHCYRRVLGGSLPNKDLVLRVNN
jgi:hypothetical protein